ncbi:MAG TPA: methyltransferase domain-containing protein [Actinomycetota bacterium]|nr:methyltransferase domain-containing protein [Actinomycetota bacterium]
MGDSVSRKYEDIYRERAWAYGDKPDPDLIRALVNVPRDKALDLGGGQGRHALALSALGFDVTLVDNAPTALHQASEAAADKGLPLHTVQAELSAYEPPSGLQVCVAALLFHIPSKKTSLAIAGKIGGALARQGVFYLSMPGYTKESEAFAHELLDAAGCKSEWVMKHLVTKSERPRLPVPRRNETRALGIKP